MLSKNICVLLVLGKTKYAIPAPFTGFVVILVPKLYFSNSRQILF